MRTENSIRNLWFVIRNLKFVTELTAADEMDDLDFIGIFDADIFPILLPHDFFIQFDRNSFSRQREIVE